jgi:hypothetical protein
VAASTGSVSDALPPAVGIDVVDLDDPRCLGRSAGGRFVQRVLAPAETAFLVRTSEPVLALWALWAAKEAAYKVVSGMVGRAPVFEHAAFVVTTTSLPFEGGDPVPARVRYGEIDLPARLTLGGRCVTAWSWDPAGAAAEPPPAMHHEVALLDRIASSLGVADLPLDELRRTRFSPQESRAVHSRQSALVRLGARRAAARVLGGSEAELTIVCAEGPTGRVPPRLHRRGAPLPDASVSLSHHGRWGAWALRAGSAGSEE